jgi:hypothetical protein
VEDVVVFLKQRDLNKFVELFRKEEINGKRLLAMTDEDLSGYGVSRPVDRKNILTEVDEIRPGYINACIVGKHTFALAICSIGIDRCSWNLKGVFIIFLVMPDRFLINFNFTASVVAYEFCFLLSCSKRTHVT